MFRRGVVAAAFTGLGLSILVELTQLTGIWGIYRCSYRYFDTGDLITNTTGAVFGSLLAAVVMTRRPARAKASGPRRVTIGRRLLGMFLDVLMSGLLHTAVGAMVLLLSTAFLQRPVDAALARTVDLSSWLVVFATQAVFVLGTGSSLGEWTVLLRGASGRLPAAVALPIRLLAGIGGYVLLTALDQAWLAALLAIANLVAMLVSGSRRSLAQRLAGMAVVDARQVEPEPVDYAVASSE